jgi:hypothetical protein
MIFFIVVSLSSVCQARSRATWRSSRSGDRFLSFAAFRPAPIASRSLSIAVAFSAMTCLGTAVSPWPRPDSRLKWMLRK